MKLQHLTLENFMCHRSLQVRWGGTSPLVLACGPNEIGKSALAEALEFALRGECARLETKGARKSLITDGAKKGAVTLAVGEASLQRNVGDGKTSALAGDFALAAGNPDLWPYMLDHQAFSRLAADDRRRALYSALQVGTSVSDITVLLAERGHDASRIKLVAEPLGRSFDAAVKVAKAKASEARGAWQEVTGENYGSQKADGWRPEVAAVPEGAAAEIDQLSGRRDDLATRREALVAERHAIAAAERSASQLESEAAAARRQLGDLGCPQGVAFAEWLQGQSAYVSLASEAVGAARNDIASLRAQLDALPTVAAKPETLACPCCSSALLLIDGKLAPFTEDADPVDNSAEIQRLTALLDEANGRRDTEISNVARAQRVIDAAQPLVATVQRYLLWLEDQQEADQPRSLEAVTADIQAIDQEGGALTLRRNELRALIDSAASADARAQRAAELHADLQAWASMAEALAPSGIPAEQLSRAIRPLNDRMRESAQATGWPLVQVAEDMAITYGNRPLGLASESGRWRADAMLTEALLFLAGVRSLVLDRMDVLVVQARPALLRWLHGLALRGELESALVLASLKEPPRLPATYNVLWLGEPITQPGA